MGEILSYEDWMRMRAGRHRGDVLILDRHDAALRARLAEVEAERDEALELVAAELIEGPQTESEALARRLAEVEQALQELAHWRIAQSHDAVQMRSLARAVLDKGEPTDG